ncbi:MAG TPA: hypothetical protein VMA35_13345 [Candidatus Sulfopaludibacter sp.]|nr:hypothetical protein [Candidatus Sulfopaludibacter sp.]
MHAETFIAEESESHAKLRLFCLYADFAASARARWVSSTIAKLVRPKWKTRCEMWHLDSFKASQLIGRIMLQEAAEADVLVIALSSLDQREPKLMEWLTALAGEKAGSSESRLFIGLLGDEDHEAGELGWTVKQFIGCAQRMGRDFIWHWMGQEACNDITWLVDNVKKFLAHKQSLSNMAWWCEAKAGAG